jgi:hypothetical protein
LKKEMPEQIVQIIWIAAGALAAMLVWALTIAYVYLDTNRRELSGGGQFIWVLLAALLPLIGFFAYLFARGLSRFISPGVLNAVEPRGSTLARPAEERQHTVFAAMPQKPAPAVGRQAPGVASTLYTASQAYIVSVIEGPHTGEVFSLKKLPALIGRGSGSFIRLDNDQGVSRRHAELYERTGELHIKDLQSSHGTHVNGQKIDDWRLKSGDQVRVGISVFRVEMNGKQDAD